MNDSTLYLSIFSEKQTNATKNANTKALLTTGATEIAKAYNIYDVSGNLWEWTEEISFYGGNTSDQYRIYRGGGFGSSMSPSPVCYRNGNHKVDSSNSSLGFRVVLYMR